MKMLNTINFDYAKRLTALAIALVFCIVMFAPMASVAAPGVAPIKVAQQPGQPLKALPRAAPPIALTAPEPELPDTIVIQPNATVGKDTYIWGVWPNDNYGDAPNIFAGSWSLLSEIHTCIQFPLPSNPKTVKSATLSLYVTQTWNAAFNCSVHALNSSWDEGNGGTEAANWTYRTAGSPWATPGGDYSATPSAYMWETPVNTWMNFNVTAIVNDWNTNVKMNNGFLLRGNNLVGANDLVEFASSDYFDARFHPKLTISYAAEITDPIGAQVMQEDDAARIIPLSGRGAGSVEHISFTNTALGTGSNLPFGGTMGDQMRVQYLYTPDQVGSEGVLRKISFNKELFPTYVGWFGGFRVRVAHTDLMALTTTFDNNCNGFLTEVFPTADIFVNASNGSTWLDFDLNNNFTYDNAHNLLIDITWTSDDGRNVPVNFAIGGAYPNTMLYDVTGAATGLLDDMLVQMRFLVDAADNVAVESGNNWNYWPFTDETDGVWSMRMQMLYHRSMVNKSGCIDTISFQAYEGIADWCVLENVSIRLGHTSRTNLTDTFDSNVVGTWTTVFTKPSYNFTSPGDPGFRWIVIDVDDTFVYNNVDNLIIDIRWQESEYSGLGANSGLTLTANWSCPYYSRLCESNINATTASPDSTLYNARFVFADSANLTWSAVSNMPLLFSAIVLNRELVITPQANQFGLGSVTLTLTNNNGGSTFQLIQVTINAVNDAPVLAPITPITCVEDIAYALNIQSLISDIDDPIAYLTVSTSSTFATVNGTVIRFLYPEGVTHENVTVTVRDRSGLEDSEVLDVTVTQINDDPEFTTFPATVTCDATVSKAVPLNMDDEETNDANLLMYTNSEHINVTGHTLHLLYPKGIGTETVTVYLVDEMTYGVQNNVSYTMTVTIIDHPEVTNNTPTGTSVPIVSPVKVTFDAEMNRTKAENAFSLKLGTTELNGTFTWNAAGTMMTFTPSSYMLAGNYSVSVAASAEDVDGIRMLNAFNWYFTVAYADYDGDGMSDSWEIENGLDPLTNDAAGDLDGDGMPNLYEYQNDLDPTVNDADEDADGDGATNLEEYEAETDPNDPDSAPADFTWIILLLVLVAVIAVVLIVVMLMRKKKPEPAPEYQEGNYPPPPPGEEPYYPPPEGSGPPMEPEAKRHGPVDPDSGLMPDTDPRKD